MIKNVIFDLEGVLTDVKNVTVESVLPADLKRLYKDRYKKQLLKDYWAHIAHNCAVSISNSKLKVKTNALVDDYYKGKLTEEEFLALVVKANDEPREVVEAVYAKLKLKSHNKLIGSTMNTIKRLREQNYKVFVFANVGVGMVDTIHYMLDDSWFDGVILSCEAKKLIPEESAFQYALKKWKLKPEETLLVDNDANNLPMFTRMFGYTILFDTANSTEENRRVLDYVTKINKVTK